VPVEIQLPQEGSGNQIRVNNVSEEYLRLARHPAYKNSTIVQNAATASRLIVTGSGYLSNVINSGAMAFTQRTKPNPKPMTFTPATQERVRKLNNLTNGAVSLSAKTVGSVGRVAQNLGATLTRRGEQKQKGQKGFDANGRPISNYKPGILNKSMIAFSTIADGIEQSAKNLLESGSTAASTMVGHKYGADASVVAKNLVGGVKNVGLVYVDAVGVSRKAVLKSVAKGMVVGRMPNGNPLVVGEGDGGQVPPEFLANEKGGYRDEKTAGGVANTKFAGEGQHEMHRPGHGEVGFGNAAPPAYEPGQPTVGEPLDNTPVQGYYGNEKAQR
jgi:spartin